MVDTSGLIRVLLADPDPATHAEFRAAIAGSRFRVDAAASTGREAVETYARTRPDLAVVSLVFPDLGGTAVIREILARDKEALIVVAYAIQAKHLAREAETVGAIVVKKPFQRDKLLERMATALVGGGHHHRFSLRLQHPLPVNWKKPGLLSRRSSTVTRDISQAGLSLFLDEPLPARQALDLSIQMSDGPPLKTKGMVMGVDRSNDGKHYAVGIAFTEITQEDRTRLRQYIIDTLVK
ncbi:MAG: PilZ domain-containing protein [Planctomycetes bacterium]|nr:PilZ domain-containing protein [Planctomycetota bacterium]